MVNFLAAVPFCVYFVSAHRFTVQCTAVFPSPCDAVTPNQQSEGPITPPLNNEHEMKHDGSEVGVSKYLTRTSQCLRVRPKPVNVNCLRRKRNPPALVFKCWENFSGGLAPNQD